MVESFNSQFADSETQYDVNNVPEIAWYDSQKLRMARDLLADPQHWTKRWSARDAVGKEVSATSSEATCFCSLGVLELFGVRSSYWLYRAMDKLGYDGLITIFNDRASTTHDDVMRVFNTAVALAEDADLSRRNAAH